MHAAAERGPQPGTPGALPVQQARTRSSTPGLAPGDDAAQVLMPDEPQPGGFT